MAQENGCIVGYSVAEGIQKGGTTMHTKLQSPFSRADFWQGHRLPYFVAGAFRQNADGDPLYPVPDTHANCWVILNEAPRDDDGPPFLTLIGQFGSRQIAACVCELILQNCSETLA
jgi:hypothetical protein